MANFDFWVSHALDEIKSTYGDVCTIKPKSLLKFGSNSDIDANVEETVWARGGHETFATSNSITHISSDDAGDTQVIVIEGHTVSGGELTFVTQSVTLSGQTKVALTTPLFRASRFYNNNSTDLSGTVYIYEDDTVTAGVPQTSAKIHLQSSGSNNQSLKASTSFSSVDYGLLTHFYANVNKKTAASVDFKMQIRLYGKVFRTVLLRSAHSTGAGLDLPVYPFIIIPPNSDIRITAESDTANTSVSAGFNSLLAIKT
jgi:hypothetical protein